MQILCRSSFMYRNTELSLCLQIMVFRPGPAQVKEVALCIHEKCCMYIFLHSWEQEAPIEKVHCTQWPTTCGGVLPACFYLHDWAEGVVGEQDSEVHRQVLPTIRPQKVCAAYWIIRTNNLVNCSYLTPVTFNQSLWQMNDKINTFVCKFINISVRQCPNDYHTCRYTYYLQSDHTKAYLWNLYFVYKKLIIQCNSVNSAC